jgi:hypothetical protein
MPKIHKISIKRQKVNFINAYKKSLGILSPALTQCRIGYKTYKTWFMDDPIFREQCLDVENFQGDWVENALMSKIEQGDTASILFYLRCRRKDKWNDKQTVTIEGSIDHTLKQISINVVDTETKLLMDNTVKLIDSSGEEVK